MSWNFIKNKNKEQPKKKGAKGKSKNIYYILFYYINIL